MEEIIEIGRLAVKLLLNFILHIFWVFPLKKNRISLINDLSYTYGDNLKYICEYLEKYYSDRYEIIFPLKKKYEINNLNIRIITPKPKTLFAFYYFLTSSVLITNVGGISYLPLRKKQLVLNTWHGGGPYKKTGIDTSRNRLFSYDMKLTAKKTTFILSSCEVFTKKESKALLFPENKCLNIGSPRNDIMFKKGLNIKQKVYSYYGIKADKKIVLYAPTFRNKNNKVLLQRTTSEIELNYVDILNACKTKWGGEWIFAQRFHPLLKTTQKDDYRESVINFSNHPDMQELLYVASVVISDYSSLMWDFSLTERPCFILSNDIEEYEQTRGFYIPIKNWPYPIAHNNNELIRNIVNFDENEYVKQLQQHYKEAGNFERGTACKQVTDLIYNFIN